MPRDADIAESLEAVRRRITAAAQRAHRDPASITLVAVSKTFGDDVIRAAVNAGQRAFGENRVQEASGKIDALASLGLEWHLIGHLQSNKAKKAAASFAWIESIDSVELLKKVDAAAAEQRVAPRVLVQVDLAHEATKHGAVAAEAKEIVGAALEAKAVQLEGLMIVPPFPDHAEDSRPWFRQLREMRDALIADGVPADRLTQLSMGMSHDYEIAIEEGATMVRVGTAIFGRR